MRITPSVVSNLTTLLFSFLAARTGRHIKASESNANTKTEPIQFLFINCHIWIIICKDRNIPPPNKPISKLIAYIPVKINENHKNTRFHRALLSTHWKGAKTDPKKLAHSEKNI
jgi:hypothetical protein